VTADDVVDGIAGERPDNGAQFGCEVERKAVVDSPEAPLGVLQDVPTLPVRVVDHDIERSESPEVLEPFLREGEEVTFGIVLDESL